MISPIQYGNAGRRKLQLKRAIVGSFSAGKDRFVPLGLFREGDWKRVLWWLDVSGMALYFLAQIGAACAEEMIPNAILASLRDRHARNRRRTDSLLQETVRLAAWFDSAGVAYAVLKGVSLVPDSVPEAALRSQSDLDFVISRSNADTVREGMRRLGYTLFTQTDYALEFRKGAMGSSSIANIYSDQIQRVLEIHIDDDGSERLERRCFRDVGGSRIASLSEADILVGQAMHLLKHLCDEYTRLSWLLEFKRHVEARRGDVEFWCEVERIAGSMRQGNVAMAVSLRLAGETFHLEEDGIPTQWRCERIPDRVLLWLDFYAIELLLSDSVGSKLYALLRSELARCELGEPLSTRRVLFPTYLPKRITEATGSETPAVRMRRYLVQARYAAARLYFHVTAGARLVMESTRWRRAAPRCGRTILSLD